jgi:hypothetical protein
MRGLRLWALLALGAILTGGHTLAQVASGPTASPATDPETAPTQAADGKTWSFSASAYTYVLPGIRDYVQPTVAADRGRLHLEVRYNYEDRNTGSAWIGCKFSAGDKLTFEVTPMLGVVSGNTDGVAPGYKASLGYRKWELYTEGEYVFDTGHSSNNYFYTWSELTLTPVDWFRFGLVVQRTKLYHTDFDIQRGFLVAFEYKRATLAAYLLNPDAHRPMVVLALSLGF